MSRNEKYFKKCCNWRIGILAFWPKFDFEISSTKSLDKGRIPVWSIDVLSRCKVGKLTL